MVVVCFVFVFSFVLFHFALFSQYHVYGSCFCFCVFVLFTVVDINNDQMHLA